MGARRHERARGVGMPAVFTAEQREVLKLHRWGYKREYNEEYTGSDEELAEIIELVVAEDGKITPDGIGRINREMHLHQRGR